jgi:hypothetical protein
VALEALREDRTANQIASQYEIHPSRVGLWKKIAQKRLSEVFENGEHLRDDKGELIDLLYQQIGRLQVELEWAKKKSSNYLD